MPYHLFLSRHENETGFVFDQYLGSAVTLDFYWESVGRQLKLPIISSIAEKADSDDGFALAAEKLLAFRQEMLEFENYWICQRPDTELPAAFLGSVQTIIMAVNEAIEHGRTARIGSGNWHARVAVCRGNVIPIDFADGERKIWQF